VDVRIIATTNRDLAEEAAAGTFRQDLFYRLSVIPVAIPPLRDRPEDVALLATRFAVRTAKEIKKEFKGIASDALSLMQRYEWPGNVRELQHVIERAVILSPDPVLQASSLDGTRFGLTHGLDGSRSGERRRPSFPTPARSSSVGQPVLASAGRGAGAASAPGAGITLESLDVNAAERVLIQHALVASGNNRTRAAELLGISVRTLRNKLNGPGRSADGSDGEDDEG
jgi:DNA-binding NtrC family response regulator